MRDLVQQIKKYHYHNNIYKNNYNIFNYSLLKRLNKRVILFIQICIMILTKVIKIIINILKYINQNINII